MSAAILTSVLLLAGACSKADDTVATQPTTQGGVEATSPTVKKTGTTEKTTDDTEVTDETTTTKKKTPATDKATTTTAKATPTTKASTTGPEFALTSVDALKVKLGEFKALEMTIHFASGFTSVQVQDPAKPANVDEYQYKGGSIDGPTPVKLTGDGDLESNLFASTEIAWDKIPVMMEQAKTSIPLQEGSKGITHIIVKKNLPFDSDTVLDVYVDGGTRSDGGYVMFKADGTLKKVYGPS
jgi:hypothetical protein